MITLLFLAAVIGQPPQAPALRELPQAPAVREIAGEWSLDTSTPGQLNYYVGGIQVGALRIADRVYMELQSGQFVVARMPVAAIHDELLDHLNKPVEMIDPRADRPFAPQPDITPAIVVKSAVEPSYGRAVPVLYRERIGTFAPAGTRGITNCST